MFLFLSDLPAHACSLVSFRGFGISLSSGVQCAFEFCSSELAVKEHGLPAHVCSLLTLRGFRVSLSSGLRYAFGFCSTRLAVKDDGCSSTELDGCSLDHVGRATDSGEGSTSVAVPRSLLSFTCVFMLTEASSWVVSLAPCCSTIMRAGTTVSSQSAWLTGFIFMRQAKRSAAPP